MSLNEVFAKFLNDEHPPKLVFCMFGKRIASIKLKELHKYIYKYRCVGIDNKYNIPILEYYNV